MDAKASKSYYETVVKTDPEKMARRKEYDYNYYRENRETIIARQMKYYWANHDKCVEAQREYRRKNPDKVSELNRRMYEERKLEVLHGRSKG